MYEREHVAFSNVWPEAHRENRELRKCYMFERLFLLEFLSLYRWSFLGEDIALPPFQNTCLDEHIVNGICWLCPNTHPVLDAIGLEYYIVVFYRVVTEDLFEFATL